MTLTQPQAADLRTLQVRAGSAYRLAKDYCSFYRLWAEVDARNGVGRSEGTEEWRGRAQHAVNQAETAWEAMRAAQIEASGLDVGVFRRELFRLSGPAEKQFAR